MLFLDELSEFSRPALEALRVPLEERAVTIARAHGSISMPADCVVVAAMNPCPCGYTGDPAVECTCTAQRLAAYVGRLSGPLLDRFELRVHAPRALAHGAAGEPSAAVADRVAAAREQLATAGPRLGEAAERLLTRGIEATLLSGRAAARARAVSRTIAALSGTETVSAEHMAEALAYREVR